MLIEGTFLQNHRRNFGPEEAGKFYEFQCVRKPALAREDIEQFPAVAAHDGLNRAMQTAVLAARNFRAVLTQRTLE